MKRPTWAEISLDNLAFNFHSAKTFIGTDISYMAVVKADAYGHGAPECAARLEAEGVDWLAVAIVEEGIDLRKKGITKPILCFGSFWNGQEEDLIGFNLTPTIFRIESARNLNRLAQKKRIFCNIHLKIDTGMNRVGIRFDDFDEFFEQLAGLQNLKIDGLMTHFAAADDLGESDFTNLQIERLNMIQNKLKTHRIAPRFIDLANSPGAVAHPAARGNMVRLGGILYGLGGDVLPKGIKKPELKAVMALYSEISFLKKVLRGETIGYSRTFITARDSIIATIPIGYYDGYPRLLSNKTEVIINDQKAPVVGRISMDWILADVTGINNCQLGDKVTLIGESEHERITAEELAGKTSTISYEITCGISRRVPKIFI